jgi:phenylacetic acid degradation operon negative regulatory protein
MKNPSIDKWIQRFLATDPPRSKSVVMTVFGDSIAPHGGAVWLGSLIELLAPFGISDRLVRTSIFRLADEGWLEARREGRRSLYTLTGSGLRRFELAYRRIYAPPNLTWQGSWTILFAPPGTINADERGALRKELLWEGFSMLAPGVFGHPGDNNEVLEDILGRVGVRGKLFICQASELSQVSTRPLRDLVEHGWELKPVLEGYQHFIKQFGSLLAQLDDATEPEQAFVIRTLLMHAFRRVQLHDPLLPLELLPKNWPGIAAYELCREIYQRTYASAEQYLMTTLQREDENVAPAAPTFYQRFGGLLQAVAISNHLQ